MRALVTGAAGFVGGHLVDHLRASGDDVACTDRTSGGPDLLDAASIRQLVEEVRPEVVYHLAGQADVGGSWDSPVQTLRTNAEGTLILLDAVRVLDGARVVTVSSADVYGVVDPDDLPTRESAPLRPVSPYAASKAAADLLALQAHLGHGLDVVRARSFNHLGPGQSDRFVCSALASRIAAAELAGEDSIRVGNLDARRDFTDVRDVVRAYRCLAVDGRPGAAYNVCTGTTVSIREVAERLVEIAGRDRSGEGPDGADGADGSRPTGPNQIRLLDDPSLHRPVDVAVSCGDPTAIRSDTGWQPELSLDRTLVDLLEYWRERLRPDPEAD
jgi:GDP-4-dehydro-6-deoxy-D-mannose reductase